MTVYKLSLHDCNPLLDTHSPIIYVVRYTGITKDYIYFHDNQSLGLLCNNRCIYNVDIIMKLKHKGGLVLIFSSITDVWFRGVDTPELTRALASAT